MPRPTVDPEHMPREPTLIFDGDCGFCTRAAYWVRRRAAGDLRAIPWQRADLASHGLTEVEARAAAWWIDGSGARFRAQRAIGKALACGRGWTRILGLWLLLPPFVWLAAPVYRVVARFRGYLPGGTPACREGGESGPSSGCGAS